jgi:predicted AAA+ superfamily ATPase
MNMTARKKDIIERPYYTEKIQPHIDKPIIKILTGQRRIGKSYILLRLMDIIRNANASAQIIYVSKELKEFSKIQTDDDLYRHIASQLNKEEKNYVFIDEIQEIPEFQHSMRSLLAEGNCDIYCTGSNANMLSGELATFLAGRYLEFPVHSLSYKEFIRFHQLSDSNETLQKYMRIGGMPYLIHLNGDEQLSFEYLRNLYSTILLKDVITRRQVRNIDFMERLVGYIADNVGSLFSSSNIAKYLKSQRQQVPTQLVIDYSLALTQAYFIHKVSRIDIQGLKIFEIGEKYYFEDIGIRNAIRGMNPLAEIQKWMENLVYMQLIRGGFTVYVGKTDQLEIDFVGQRLQERIYVQVCFRLEVENTRKREVASLQKTGDNFPKYIVTLDDYGLGVTAEGIHVIHLREFLLREM